MDYKTIIDELNELAKGNRWLSLAQGQIVFSPRVPVVTKNEAMDPNAVVQVVDISDLIEVLRFKDECRIISATMSSSRPAMGTIPAKEGIEFIPPFPNNKPLRSGFRVVYYARLEPWDSPIRETPPPPDADGDHHRKDFLNVGDE